MRDILVTIIVIGGCLYTFKRPYIGVLLWSWLSYMNPHRLAYGFAYSMPFAQMAAISLLIAILFTKEKKSFPFNGLTIIWLFFIFYMGLTTLLAYYPEAAQIQYIKVIKIQLIVFLTMMLITDMTKLRQLIWVIVLSIGFYSVKGGIFTLLTGGGYRVWGPPDSFIADNNGLAIAILMVIPLMIYLYQTTTNKWVKMGLIFAIITSLFTVLGSQSRGALLAIMTVGAFFWLKSHSKGISTVFIIVMTATLLMFMPESWYNRMETIETYQSDGSAMGRINAWKFAYYAANDNFFGLGFDGFTREMFSIYADDVIDFQGAHSIYFSVLGDHGWFGLILFIVILMMTWIKLNKVIKETQKNNDLKELTILSKMIKISLLAYMSGGAFLNLAYFDLPYHLFSFSIILYTVFSSYKKERVGSKC